MASPVAKQPLKIIEIPLSKFTEDVIPHHQKLYDKHRTNILKLISNKDVEEMKKEIKDKKRALRQLKDLMYELDTLRSQVEDNDLDKFDAKTMSLRKTILNLTTGYQELQNLVSSITEVPETQVENKENENPFYGAPQIQIQESLDDLRLKEHQETLNRVEAIHEDVKDLHEIYSQVHEMVGTQGETVAIVEESIESTNTNVNAGVKHILNAHKLKAAAYPVSGALIGGIIGGPIGLVAGLKVGGIAAITCAVAGYGGGTLFKKINDSHLDKQSEVVEIGGDKNASSNDKKDI